MNGNLEGNFTHGEIARMTDSDLFYEAEDARLARQAFIVGQYNFAGPHGFYRLSPEHEETEIAYLERDIWNLVQEQERRQC